MGILSYRVVDTTMRDGEQKAGIAYSKIEKIKMATKLDSMGIYQIEAGIPAMKGEEKESICEIMKLGLKAKISSWNRMNIEDIKHSLDCGVDIIHISAPSSDIQINSKLKKDKQWVIDNLIQCLEFVDSKKRKITVGFEDATRADINFLEELCLVCEENQVSRIRLADTVGIMTPSKTFEIVSRIKNKFNLGIEIHAHNDFGMAVANSIAAVKAGAGYVNCTLNGIGERAGNCDYYKVKELDSLAMRCR
ncbi:homocitrate synthase [Clostridium grantii]|uniref:Homocitrate synthase NifV n=1 Tax=Clostridium grantii DSM 8605 TaxID=1121316 RepID=A0A1M5UX94_9CLOT|nr:homocitrate synthase [Clostridium grantii]SHH67544.1 homocitrate synthase NifV [Clostridium grantii DSM 8605]